MKKLFFLLFCFVLCSPSLFANEWEIKVVQPNMNTQNVNGFDKLKVHDIFSGAGVYDIPMNFPKGPKNIGVGLNMMYNSYSRDAFSPYGISWNLQGAWTIQRSIKQGTTEIYNRNDFTVNGEELVLTDESKNLYESKYTNNFNKYYLENNTWRVVDTKGNTYVYGEQDISRLSDPENINKIFAWYLDSLTDNRWNTINYSYFKHNNQVYLEQISYAAGLYKINFNYQDKDRSLSSYKSHFEVKTSKILDTIEFVVENKKVKYYDFTYDNIHNVFSHLTNFKEIIIWENNSQQTVRNIDLSYGMWADMHLLKTVNTNTGLEVNFTYKPSVFYKDSEGNNLNPVLPFNMRTLHIIDYKDTVNNVSKQEVYTYADGAFYFDQNDLYGREYAGFWKVTKDTTNGKKEIYYFHQGANSKDSPELGEFEDHISKKGKTFRVETYDANKVLLKSEITKWISEFENNNRWKTLKNRETKNLINGNNITTTAIQYSYDVYGNVTQQINYWEVKQTSNNWDFNDILEDKRTSNMSYTHNDTKNLYWFIIKQELFDFSDTLASKKEIIYDNSLTNSVEYGDVTSVKTHTTQNDFVEEKSEYNAKGLLTKSINPRGYITEYSYDSYGIYPTSKTDAKGFIESYEYNYIAGKPSKVTSINNLETSYSYDNAGRLLSESVKLENTDYTTKQISYDDVNIPNSIHTTVHFDKNNQNIQNIYVYKDGFGNDIQVKKSFHDQFITNKLQYDGNGNTLFTSYPTYENNSSYTVLNKQSEFGNSYEYDDLNRVVKITNKSWDIIYDYNNLDFSITNQKGITTQYDYDVFGNLVVVTEPGNIKTRYSYTANNQLTKIVDAQNNERSISYNIAWQRLSIEDLHTTNDTNFGTRIYSYDENGNIATFTSLAWEVITYQYDELDRITSEAFNWSTTSFHYDSGSNAKWMLTSYSKWDYSESYTYNEQWFLIWETKSYGADNYSYSYDYDLLGQKVATTYPDNSVITNSYENSVPTGVKYNNTDLVTTINHNPTGVIDDVTYGNGAITKNIYDYEHGYRLKKKWIMFGDAQYGLTSYTFDTVGNITNLKEAWNIPEFLKDVTYSYDNLNRLTQANYSPSEIIDYSYNDIWNIMSNSRVGNYSYVDNGRNNPHAVTLAGTQSFAYDHNGNIINDSVNNYIYNAKDELTQSSNSGTVTNYTYNSQWIRVEKLTGTSVNRYVNKDYEVEISNSWSGQTVNVTKYIFIGDKKLATVEGTDIIYHHEDHLGWGNIDLDSSWNLLQVVDYYPFGSIRTKKNYSDYENKYLFGWKEQDSETDLQYFEARYYDNGIWRFNSIDRVFWEAWESQRHYNGLYDPQKLNAYSYVSNNPLTRTDDSGEWWDVAVDTVVAGIWLWVWKVSWNEYLVIWAKNMLKETLNPKNALNPVKKIKKVQKLTDVSKKVDSKSKDFFKNTKYTDKVLKQASNKSDSQHSFSKHVDWFAARNWKVEKIPNIKWWSNDRLSVEWSHKWVKGTFDYIKDNNGNINHRKFTPNKNEWKK